MVFCFFVNVFNTNKSPIFLWENLEIDNILSVSSRKLMKFPHDTACSLDQFGFSNTNKIHHSWEKKMEMNNILSISSRKLMKFLHDTAVLISLVFPILIQFIIFHGKKNLNSTIFHLYLQEKFPLILQS